MVFSQKLVDRYKELKQDVPECLLLMQVGAFMQVMDKDARIVSGVTGLKLQMAGDVDAPVVLGSWWEFWGGYPAHLLPRGWHRFPDRRLLIVSRLLWKSGLRVAWVRETGRRVTGINERVLVRRWPGASRSASAR
jgi:hypothetical protein